MSRIGKKPVEILAGVTVSVAGSTINVEGPAGKLSFEHRPEVTVEVNSDDNIVLVDRINEHRESRAFHGLTRALINNMIIGVKEGYEKRLEIVGVGYNGQIQGDTCSCQKGNSDHFHEDSAGYSNSDRGIPASIRTSVITHYQQVSLTFDKNEC